MKILNFDRSNLMCYFSQNYFQGSSNLQIAEIGSYEGSFAKLILGAFPDCSLNMVDLWQTENNDFYYSVRSGAAELAYEIAKKNFSHLSNVKMHKGLSSVISSNFDDESLDLVYIDADHSYEGALKDLQLWYSKVKSGGIVSGHDCNADPGTQEHYLFGVQAAIKNFYSDTDRITLTNERYHKSWYWVKP